MSLECQKYQEALLCCLSLDGSKRYELPAIFKGYFRDYAVYLRPEPKIIHHTKNKIFELPSPEILLVSIFEYHVISLALTNDLKLDNMYININLVPEKYDKGFYWHDLELDIRIFNGHDGFFKPIVIDIKEYEEQIFDEDHKLICEREISKMIERTFSRTFPFDPILLESFIIEQWKFS
jgi:hypothetical protein